MATLASPSSTREGKKVPAIELHEQHGDHLAMGIMQGERVRDHIGGLHNALFELLGLDAGTPIGSLLHRGAPTLASAAGMVGRRFMERDLKRHYPRQYDRLCGIAEGAGAGVHSLFIGPAVELALNRVSYQMPGACSAVAITGGKSSDGEPIIAKNFDYPDAARDSYLARLSCPSGYAASLDVTAAPMSGSHEGINEHGLAVAYNYGFFRGTGGCRVPITNLVQELLEECRTVRGAIEYLEVHPRSGGAILMIADAAGDLASVEVSPSHVGVRRASEHGDWLTHTNHAMTDEIIPFDVPRGAVHSKFNIKRLRGMPVQVSTLRRQQRAVQLLGAAGVMGEADLVDVASDHANQLAGDDNTLCRHGPYFTTTCSVLLFPRRRTLKVMFGAPCEYEYATFVM